MSGQDQELDHFVREAQQAFGRDFDREMPDQLVVSLSAAAWIPQDKIPNPSRIAPLLGLSTRTFDLLVQEIPVGAATDMHRHAHEAVHVVLDGSGYSEIGPRRCAWQQGDLVHTPVWAWHRHYNTGAMPVRMLIIEGARLLQSLGLHERETAGLIDYQQLSTRRHRDAEAT